MQRAPPCVRCGRLRLSATDLISVTPCVALDVLLLVLRTGSAIVVAGVEQRSAVRTGQPAARRNVTGTRRRSSGDVTRARPATHVHCVRLVSSPPALQFLPLTSLRLQPPVTSQVTVFFLSHYSDSSLWLQPAEHSACVRPCARSGAVHARHVCEKGQQRAKHLPASTASTTGGYPSTHACADAHVQCVYTALFSVRQRNQTC